MWQIVGHRRAVESLQREIDSGMLPHALLFTGPAGVGKTRLAQELAKAVMCVGDAPPCQACIQCHQIESGSHPDLSVVERADGKDNIAIQQIRELRETASLRPFQARRKVYIVAGAESLTPQAADALLKTLEEPQPAVTMVLTASDADAVPSTVLSRCRHVPLGPVDRPSIEEALIARGEDAGQAARLARLARGSVGWALRAASQPKLVTQQEEMMMRVGRVLDLDIGSRLQLAEDLTADRKDRTSLRRAMELLLLLARDLLLVTEGRPPQLAEGTTDEALRGQAARYSVAQIHAYIRSIGTAMKRIDANVDPRLALEALLVNLP